MVTSAGRGLALSPAIWETSLSPDFSDAAAPAFLLAGGSGLGACSADERGVANSSSPAGVPFSTSISSTSTNASGAMFDTEQVFEVEDVIGLRKYEELKRDSR
jgi:hypothetical protein